MKRSNEPASVHGDYPAASVKVLTEEEKVIVRGAESQVAAASTSTPPRVPFYDDDEAARRRRMEPTALIPGRGKPTPQVFAPPSAMIGIEPPPAAKRGRLVIVLVALLLGGGAIAAAFLGRRYVHREQAAGTLAAPPTSATVPLPTVSAPPVDTTPATSVATASAAPSASAPAPAVEETVLSIETIPSRAAVFIDGTKMGVSPVELKLPKSNDPVRLELRHPGYFALKERVVPNVNQRLRLTLIAGRSPTSPTPTPSATPYPKFE